MDCWVKFKAASERGRRTVDLFMLERLIEMVKEGWRLYMRRFWILRKHMIE